MARMPNLRSRNLWWAAAAIGGVTLLALGAFLFVNSYTTGHTLDDAAALRTADMTLAGQDVAMKSIGQLVLLAQDASLGVADQADVDLAATAAQQAVAEAGTRFASLDSEVGEDLAPAFDSWQEAAARVISAATSGLPAQSEELLVSTLAPAAEALVGELIAERDNRAQRFDDARDSVSALSRTAGFLTIFLIPLLAILFYRLAARRQLQEATAHLDARIEAEKTVAEEKDQFIASVSDELRTPLAAIYGFSEELLDSGMVDPGAGDLVDMINRESAELARMAEDLLVAAHDETVPLRLDEFVLEMGQEITEVIGPFQRRGHAIGGTWGEGKVLADPIRLRQILRNLIANAVQHGGPDIRIYGDAAGSNYVVSVEDNGEGIPEHLADRLFTRFVHRGRETAAGSVGIGLAVANMLAEAMGGSLDYERVADRTAFVLSIPLASVQGR